MNSTVNIPLTKVYVKNEFLGLEDGGITEAYWYGITSVPARQFLCHIMLFNGSNWYGLPISCMSTNGIKWNDTIADGQSYDCFSYDITLIRFDFLRDQKLKIRDNTGTYMFTIVSHDNDGRSPFAEFPEQAKTYTFIALDEGGITCAPNNYITWIDRSLYDNDDVASKYKRIDKVFRSER